MWISLIIAGLVIVLGRSMRVEAMASANAVAAIQAGAAERGAEQYVLQMIDQQKDAVLRLTEDYFEGVPVGEEALFWVIRPKAYFRVSGMGDPDPQEPYFGVTDEASKLNVNTANEAMLMMLPGMTEDVAAAIVDWRDEDTEPAANGAENEFYLSLPSPYYCKNAPFESVEELLLVRNVMPAFLYGNASGSSALAAGVAAPLGQAGVTGAMPASDYDLARGRFDDLTVYSAESAGTEGAAAKVSINSQDARTQLADMLTEVLGASRSTEVMGRVTRQPFVDVFDFYFRTGLTPSEFQLVADRLTTTTGVARRGLINVNTASRTVLLCLPGLDENDVDTLITRRASVTGGAGGTGTAGGLGWVAEALGNKSVGLGNFITGGSSVYSADIVAASANGRAYRHCRVVIDARTSPPHIVYRKDLSDEGWPLDPQILAALRTGTYAGRGRGASSMRSGI